MSEAALAEARDLVVRIPTGGQSRVILSGVNLSLRQGEMVGLVGESGSGKSMTARAIDRLLPKHAQVEGDVLFEGESVFAMNPRQLRTLRSSISMIFQDPKAHTNPVRSIGDFLCEALRLNQGVPKAKAEKRAVELLSMVGIGDATRRLAQYPHQFSGGMLQRVMIAAALSSNPRLLLADEPTTALDVTIQAEIVSILRQLRDEQGLAILFITHDLDLAAATCDRIFVMYAGRVIEAQPARALFEQPLHPYTAALLRSRPRIDARDLPPAVPGAPVAAFEAPPGCEFSTRCPFVIDRCRVERPLASPLAGGRVACHRAAELLGTISRGPIDRDDVSK
jgi:oligopeptide/dipeptide ABC transporter ATP-binding protein